MEALTLHWRTPELLLLLLGALPLFLWQKKRKNAKPRLGAFADLHLLKYLLVGRQQGSARQVVLGIAFALAVIAAAGPFFATDIKLEAQRQAVDIAVVIDISPSMALSDVSPSRLQRAKWELNDFISRLSKDRLALITFSANAYLTLPLTHDYDTFKHFVDALDVTIVQRKGSNLARSLRLAEQALQASKRGSRAVIVLSDGENSSPGVREAAQALGDAGIPVYTLGIGTRSGAPVVDARGRFIVYEGAPRISSLDAQTLSEIASITEGSYIEVADDNSEWKLILSHIEQLIAANPYAIAVNDIVPLFPWFILASLLLILILSRRTANLATILLACAMLPTPEPVHAGPFQEQQALALLTSGDVQRAEAIYQSITTYSGRMGLGVATYRQGRWQDALKAFEEAEKLAKNDTERANARYNTGNTLTKLGRLAEAEASYRRALQWQANFSRAALNLNLVIETQALQANRQALATAAPQERLRADPLHEQTDQGARTQHEARRIGVGNLSNSTQEIKTNTRASSFAQSTLSERSVHDDAQHLLRQRFAAQDQQNGLTQHEDKPW